MNLPNKLSVLRLFLVPVVMFFILFPVLGIFWSNICAAAIFLIASLTDMLDGKIARKYNLITDFGKFLDPLADKFLVLGAMLSLTAAASGLYQKLMLIAVIIVVFRELAVTSLRLLVSGSSGVVIAANILGKIKTNTQIVFVMAALLEGVIFPASFAQYHIITYVAMAFMTVMTVWSGINYMKSYWKYLDSKK